MHTASSINHRGYSLYPILPRAMQLTTTDADPWHERLCDASVLPEQFFSPQTSFFTGRPVAALLRAVLEDALICFQSQFLPEGGYLRQEAQEAKAWFWSKEDRSPFSFVTVCAVLGLEPEAIRQRLERWSHAHSIKPQRKIRRISAR
jgi:hypothetical protein